MEPSNLPSDAPRGEAVPAPELRLTLVELSRTCRCSVEWVLELVGEGALDPLGDAPEHWVFDDAGLRRARAAQRLQADLGLNAAGAALVLDLLERIRSLEAQRGR